MVVAKPRNVDTALVELGVTVVKSDSEEVHGLCPAHKERTGEEQRNTHWSVNRATGYHNCFSCGYSGTFLDLVMDLKFKNDAFHASRWIRKNGIRLFTTEDLAEYTAPARARREAMNEEGPRKTEIGEARLALFFKPPLEQLEERFLTPESAEFYDVLWDFDKQGWVLPIRMPDGKLVGWQFKNSRFFRNYPNDVPKGQCVFGLEMLDEGQTAVLVESPLDCLRLRAAGITGGVSSYGAGVTDVQMRRLLQKTGSIIIALDNDREGKLQTRLLLRGEEKRGKIVRKGWGARFPDMKVFNYGDLKAKDPGDMSDDEILEAVATALPLGTLHPTRVKDRSKPGVHGGTQSLPGRGGQPNLRQRAATRRLRDGAGQDRRNRLRRRGTA